MRFVHSSLTPNFPIHPRSHNVISSNPTENRADVRRHDGQHFHFSVQSDRVGVRPRFISSLHKNSIIIHRSAVHCIISLITYSVPSACWRWYSIVQFTPVRITTASYSPIFYSRNNGVRSTSANKISKHPATAKLYRHVPRAPVANCQQTTGPPRTMSRVHWLTPERLGISRNSVRYLRV